MGKLLAETPPTAISAAAVSSSEETEIPFQGTPFSNNPLDSSGGKQLPPIPPALLPQGPGSQLPAPSAPAQKMTAPPPLVAPPSPPPPTKPIVVISAPLPPVKPEVKKEESSDSSTNAVPQAPVTPFLKWVQENARAQQMALEAAKKYQSQAGANTQDPLFEMFTYIRFPYVGTESPPPGGSAVIYSTPKE